MVARVTEEWTSFLMSGRHQCCVSRDKRQRKKRESVYQEKMSARAGVDEHF